MSNPIIEPPVKLDLLSGHAGRGRAGKRPQVIVYHIQQGKSSPGPWFLSLDNDPNKDKADCTIWNPQAASEVLHRFLLDSDTPWTNGFMASPNQNIALIAEWFRQGIYPNDYCLTIEHEGFYNESGAFPQAQIQRTIDISIFWCKTWGIPADRQHLLLHSDFDSVSRPNCPGYQFPLDAVIQAVAQAVNPPQIVTSRYFPETKKYLTNDEGFLDFWNLRGGLEIFGFPATGATGQTTATGQRYVTQSFERARFERYFQADGKTFDGPVRLGLVEIERLTCLGMPPDYSK